MFLIFFREREISVVLFCSYRVGSEVGYVGGGSVFLDGFGDSEGFGFFSGFLGVLGEGEDYGERFRGGGSGEMGF